MARSATPSASTGRTLAAPAAVRTASCSVAPLISRRPHPSAWAASGADLATRHFPQVTRLAAAGARGQGALQTSRAAFLAAGRPDGATDGGGDVAGRAQVGR